MSRSRLATVAALLSALLGACAPSPRAPADLRVTDARVVRFGLGTGVGAICPGSAVPIELQLEARVDGHDVTLFRHRRDLDDRVFDLAQVHLSSPQGTFDRDGVFHASPDVLATAQSGYVLHVRVPNGPAFAVRYPPSYACGSPFGKEGSQGVEGQAGTDAVLGEAEGHVTADGTGLAGGGRPGNPGGPGGTGPKMTVFVTWVSSPDYTRLLAARSVGDAGGLTLVEPGTTLSVVARGGPGGRGGRGGRGAAAFAVEQAGAPGGAGGRGGPGGVGGEVELVLDERFPELERWVRADVSGGVGGEGGLGGQGGGPLGRLAAGDRRGAAHYDYGQPGPTGMNGGSGAPGASGKVSIVRRDVRALFEGLGPIVPL